MVEKRPSRTGGKVIKSASATALSVMIDQHSHNRPILRQGHRHTVSYIVTHRWWGAPIQVTPIQVRDTQCYKHIPMVGHNYTMESHNVRDHPPNWHGQTFIPLLGHRVTHSQRHTGCHEHSHAHMKSEIHTVTDTHW